MVEYHVLKTHSIAARYKKPSSGEWDRVVEIESFRGNPPVPVTAIREEAFSGAKIGLVTLPKSVTTIEDRAFFESTLTSIVTLRTPGELHLKEIGNDAFRGSNLNGHLRLVCTGSLDIGPDAFSECSELEEVEIVGSGTVRLHERAFRYCHKLRVFRCMEANLTSLPEQVFENCSELHTIAIPSLKRAGPRACANCHSLHGFPAVLDSFYPDSFEGCNIRHPTIRRQKKRKCNDDTLRIPSYEEIQAMLETNEPDIPPSSFRSFHDKYRDCTPILSFTITSRSGSEKPTLRHPVIKGYFRSSLVQKDIFHFEVTFPRDAENITLTTACETKFKPMLTYLVANGSTIVQLTGMESEDGALYNVFEIEPNLGSNTVLTPKFFQEILARLCGKPRTDFVIETADQARLFLTFMEDTGLVPENILLAIRHELENYETQPKEVQKHRLEALKAFTTIDFNPITKLHIPTLDSLQSSFDQEFGGMTRVKQTYLSAAASIRQTGKMPGRRGIVLVGPPGTGKSHITQIFCKETGLELIVLDFSAMGDGTNLQGSGREFSNGTYSLIIRKALQTKQRQMRFVVQVEEVDKCPHLQNSLLNMLTGCFYDSYLQAAINTEQLFFVMTANNIDDISSPLLSRLKVIHLDSYSRDDKRKIMRKIIVPEANNTLNPGFRLQHAAEELLLDMYEDQPGMREIKNAICGDLVDAYFLEREQHPESQALRRVFTKSDVRRILGPSATCKSKTYDPNPGEVAFLYTNESGVPTRGIVQVSFCISDTPSVEILGAVGMQRDHISMAISALKRSTSFNLSEIDLVIALPEPIQSQMNVTGFPLFIALQSALREEAIAPRTLLIGGGVDLFGNGYLPKIGAMTSLIKKAIDCHADILISPEGFTARTDTVDLDKTPLIIESNSANDLARFILKS